MAVTPLAALPMYDWPEERATVDALWHRIRDGLRAAGIDAPDALTRDRPAPELWLDPDLLLGQTCAHPLATVLDGRVRYLASHRADVLGAGPGTYRSCIVVRRQDDQPDAAVPNGPGATLPVGIELGTMAFNETGSLSGHVGPMRDLLRAGRNLPARSIAVGSHRAAMAAVATGKADWAAIDCVSHALGCRHDDMSARLRIAGWTAERPSLPFITACATPPAVVSALRDVLHHVAGAVVLPVPIDTR